MEFERSQMETEGDPNIDQSTIQQRMVNGEWVSRLCETYFFDRSVSSVHAKHTLSKSLARRGHLLRAFGRQKNRQLHSANTPLCGRMHVFSGKLFVGSAPRSDNRTGMDKAFSEFFRNCNFVHAKHTCFRERFRKE